MKLTITIKMDGAAFVDGGSVEAARILKEAAYTLETNGTCNFALLDINGNLVGQAEVGK